MENKSNEKEIVTTEERENNDSGKAQMMYTLVPEIPIPKAQEATVYNNEPNTKNIYSKSYPYQMQNPASPYSSNPQYQVYNKQSNVKNYKPKPFYALNTVNGVKKQIEYYFSDENLVKDKFFKSKMDKNGYVDVNVIAEFPRMKKAKTTIDFILKGGKLSSNLQVFGNFLRSRNSWWKFIQEPLNEKPEENKDNLKPEKVNDGDFEELNKKYIEDEKQVKQNPEPEPEPEPEPVQETEPEYMQEVNVLTNGDYYLDNGGQMDYQEMGQYYPMNMAQMSPYTNYMGGIPVMEAQFNPYANYVGQVPQMRVAMDGFVNNGGYVGNNPRGQWRQSGRRGGYRRQRGRYSSRRANDRKKRGKNFTPKRDNSNKILNDKEEIKTVEKRVEETVSSLTEQLEQTTISEKENEVTKKVEKHQ